MEFPNKEVEDTFPEWAETYLDNCLGETAFEEEFAEKIGDVTEILADAITTELTELKESFESLFTTWVNEQFKDAFKRHPGVM